MREKEIDAYWKTVVDTIQDGVMIVDTEGAIVSVNKALGFLTGFSQQELTGCPCSILHCDICQMAQDKTGAHWCNLFRDGNFNMRRAMITRKDGIKIHILKNASILKSADGRILGAVETITDITELLQKDHQIEEFRRELRSENGFHGIIGVSEPMQRVFDIISNAASSDAPVIIFGESGTGKELVAKAIHDVSPRHDKPLVKVNCAALTESILESEIFGHVKGAFTGAYRDRAGRFENALGGHIFLDEIGDLPLGIQIKLLRVLEEKTVELMGEDRPIPVDVRVITATNRNLLDLVGRGKFREDLYFRINVIPIYLPPLRERAEDIPLLADAYFCRIRLKSGKAIQGIGKETLRFIQSYPWPGNVRELRSAFEYAFVSCNEPEIQPSHLPPPNPAG